MPFLMEFFGTFAARAVPAPSGAVVLRVAAFERQIKFQQPAIELGGTAAAELDQAFLGSRDVADRPVAKAGLREGFAERNFAPRAFRLLKYASCDGVAAERPGK